MVQKRHVQGKYTILTGKNPVVDSKQLLGSVHYDLMVSAVFARTHGERPNGNFFASRVLQCHATHDPARYERGHAEILAVRV